MMSIQIALLVLAAASPAPQPPDVADIRAERITIDGDKQKTYFLMSRKSEAEPPGGGFSLLIVLPGGDGGEAFQPFVKRILKYAVPPGHVVAEAVAPKWDKSQRVVWPTGKLPVRGQKFSTEQFLEAIVADVGKRKKLDKTSIFAMAWSSGGPALYAASLQKKTQLTGYYVSMSVFKPQYLPPLAAAKGRAYYIEHSPADRVCPFHMAEQAGKSLLAAGAKVKLTTYQGGHGWRGNVYPRIRSGLEWLHRASRKQKR
jgi:predicted esterase